MSKLHEVAVPTSLESASQHVADIYQSLRLLNYSTVPPLFTDEQHDTPDLVYHRLRNGDFVHIGPSNAHNTPENLRHLTDRKVNFVLWYTHRQGSSQDTTTYFIGEGKDRESAQPFVATRRDDKRYHWLEPAPDNSNRRWQRFANVVGQLAELNIVRSARAADLVREKPA